MKMHTSAVKIIISLVFLIQIIFAQENFFPSHTIAGGEFYMENVYSVKAADLDRDNDMDVIAVSRDDNKVGWYENNGSYYFKAHIISDNAGGPKDVIAVDLDGDNDIDVISTAFYGNSIYWYKNDGNQNFIQDTISTNAKTAYELSAMDIDGDNDIDVVASLADANTIAWYENVENRNFSAHIVSNSATYIEKAPVPIDLDGDKDVDILSAFNDGVVWFENDGNQNFLEHKISLSSSYLIYAIDMDKDNDIDVVSDAGGVVTWFENDGNQNFSPHSLPPPDVPYHRDLEVIDFDGDNDIDILASGSFWYQNDGNQNFTKSTLTSSVDLDWSVFAKDMDQDDDVDILVGEDENIILLINDGSQVFTEQIILSRYPLEVSSVHANDLDGDKDIDVISNGDYYGFTWFENGGDQFFRMHTTQTTLGASLVLSVDVDNDNDIDVLTHSVYDNSISWCENDGNKNFTKKTIINNISVPTSLFALDFDHDNDLDLLASISDDVTISWFENNGHQSFQRHNITTLRGGPIYPIDLDKDNDIDVLSAGDGLLWYKNDGENNFTENTINTYETYSVHAADMDIDGDIDVLFNSDGTFWCENIGNDNFIEHLFIEFGKGIRGLYAFDFYGDKALDVVTFKNVIILYFNYGPEDFRGMIINELDECPSSFYIIDVDRDSDLDFVCCNDSYCENPYRISWYENLLPAGTDMEYETKGPSEFALYNNYPNPFNPSTTIEFELPKSSNVTLKIFNILGEEVATLVSDRLTAGSYTYDWNASDMASGVYLYRLEAGDYVETRKMVLMR